MLDLPADRELQRVLDGAGQDVVTEDSADRNLQVIRRVVTGRSMRTFNIKKGLRRVRRRPVVEVQGQRTLLDPVYFRSAEPQCRPDAPDHRVDRHGALLVASRLALKDAPVVQIQHIRPRRGADRQRQPARRPTIRSQHPLPLLMKTQ
jgi:hypothetical protein